MAAGLAAEIDDLRFQPEGRVVPAPALEELRTTAERGAAEAHELAERVVILAREPDGEGLPVALEELRDRLRRVKATACRLAQLGMGVSAATMGGDRIERLDRACVAVLRAEGRVLVSNDDLALSGTTRAEVEVEVGGLICRLLVDRDPVVRASAGTTTAKVTPDYDDSLYVDWKTSTQSKDRRQWESPIAVSEAVEVLLDALLTDATVVQMSTARFWSSLVASKSPHPSGCSGLGRAASSCS